METRKGRFTVAFSNFKLMQFDRKIFFDGVKARLDSTLEQEQVEGFNFLLDQIEDDPLWDDLRNIAYALATAWHETAFSMQPVEEGYYLEAQYSKAVMVKHQKSLRYYPYYGRGFVQLTWETRRIPNYSKATKKIREQKPELVEAFEDETGKTFDLVEHPEQAMHPLIAYAVLTLGMFQGWFTGKKLSDYINDEKRDFINARRIINGTDKAGPIARHADRFFEILLSAKQKDSVSVTSPAVPNLPEGPTEEPAIEPQNTGADLTTEGSAGKEQPPAPPTVEVKAATPSWTSRIGSGLAYISGLGISVGTFLQGKLEQITINHVIIIAILVGVGYAIHHFTSKRAQERTLKYIENAENPDVPNLKVT